MILLTLVLGIVATAETIKRLMGRRLPALLELVYWLFLAFVGVHLLGLAAAQFPDVTTDQWQRPWHPLALAALVWVAIVTLLVIAAKVIAAPMAWHIRRVTPDGEDAGESLEDLLWPYRPVEGPRSSIRTAEQSH